MARTVNSQERAMARSLPFKAFMAGPSDQTTSLARPMPYRYFACLSRIEC
jgi:hypothetical protein